MKFGFIGAGNMAAAIIKGMTIGTKSYKGEDISITSKTVTSAQKLADICGAVALSSAAEVVQKSDVLVLAVKPHVLASVVPALKEEIAAKKTSGGFHRRRQNIGLSGGTSARRYTQTG